MSTILEVLKNPAEPLENIFSWQLTWLFNNKHLFDISQKDTDVEGLNVSTIPKILEISLSGVHRIILSLFHLKKKAYKNVLGYWNSFLT